MNERIKKIIKEFFKESGYKDDRDSQLFYVIQSGKEKGRTDCADPSEMLEDFIQWQDKLNGRSDRQRKIIIEKTKKK